MAAPSGFARSFSRSRRRPDGSEEILGHDRILLAHRERPGLEDNAILVALETVGVAVRADIDLAGDDRIASEAHLVEGGVLDDAARPFGTFG